MKKYVKKVILEYEKKILSSCSLRDLDEFDRLIKRLNHERLIHLLVTMFYALLTIIFMAMGLLSGYFLIIFG